MLSQIRCVGTKQRGLRTFRTIAQHGTVAQQDNQTQTVYMTRAGKNITLMDAPYSKQDCNQLKDATAKGYAACKVCNPPK
jgi:hypothetical protein